MFYKKIILNIFCSKIPCNLIILSPKGKLIKSALLFTKHSRICFYTKERQFAILAEHDKTTIEQNICTCAHFCQNIFLSFGFHKILSPQINTILLYDANYGLPVANATLNFRLLV